jgi:3-hydroxybutyryl-CoA dehydratase
MSASFTKTVTESDVQKFGEVSGDMNPVHFDEQYAKTTIFKGRIAHGVLSASYISTVLGMQMPGPGTIFMNVSCRFRAPVRIGETVTATCTVREVNQDRRRVIFDCVCKVGDKTVVDGEALVMAPERPKA